MRHVALNRPTPYVTRRLDNRWLKQLCSAIIPPKQDTTRITNALMPDLEKLFGFVNQEDDRFSKTLIKSVGSYYEGLRVERSNEFDFSLCLNDVVMNDAVHYHVIPRCYYGFQNESCPPAAAEQLHHPLDSSATIVDRDEPQPEPGFGYFVQPLSGSILEIFQREPKLTHGDHLVPWYVKRRLKQLIELAIDPHNSHIQLKGHFTLLEKSHGPALQLKYRHPDEDIKYPIDIDISPATRWSVTFKQLGINWPRVHGSGRPQWPAAGEVEQIEKLGVLLVAKRDFHWRMSFAECETTLCRSGGDNIGCRKMVQRLAKWFYKRYWKLEDLPQISSYILKNVWMWEMENHPLDCEWDTDTQLSNRLFGLIERLLDHICAHLRSGSPSLPHYFDDRDSLVTSDKQRSMVEEEYLKILEFYENTTMFMAVTEQLRDSDYIRAIQSAMHIG